MELNSILELIQRVSDSNLTSFEYEEEKMSIKMKAENREVEVVTIDSKNITGTKQQTNAGNEDTVETTTLTEESGKVVKSPLVGTFYAAPSEDAEPFVKVGDAVVKGQTLGIVEAMKLMNEIESEYDGVVEEILVENTQTVEYGQPMFRIR